MSQHRVALRLSAALIFAIAICPTLASAQDLASLEKRTTVKKLDNGLTVIISERPEAPVFSFFTHVDAGSVQDPMGQTGMAHMFEHMAFKGFPQVGSNDYAGEKVALAQVEVAYAALEAERRKRVGRDPEKIKSLEKSFKDATAAADKFVKRGEFDEIINRNGGTGVNASTNLDETVYFYSLPSNRLELWAYLESERFLHPVLREFYKERDVVQEERRLRTDSNPIGRMIEQMLETSFVAHGYHRPTVGWVPDLQSFSATDAQRFYDTYYGPANMTIALVGDLKASEAMPIIEKYFSRLPARPQPADISTAEPKQITERTVVMRDRSQPFYAEGYHVPDYRDKDDAVYDAITDLLSNGRTSRLYRSLVRDKQISVGTAGFSGFPGDKYPHLFLLYAFTAPGHTTTEVRDAIRAEIERLKTTDISDEELAMVKVRSKAALIRSLGDNEGLASALAKSQARYGDWREYFAQVDRIEKVTKADIRRIANATFTAGNRTVGIIETAEKTPAKPAPGGAQ